MSKTMKNTILSLVLVLVMVVTFGIGAIVLLPNRNISNGQTVVNSDTRNVSLPDANAMLKDGEVEENYTAPTGGEAISDWNGLKTWLAKGNEQGNAYLSNDIVLDWGADANIGVLIPNAERDKYNIKEGVTLDGCGHTITLATNGSKTSFEGNKPAGDTMEVRSSGFVKTLSGTVKNVKFVTNEKSINAKTNDDIWWAYMDIGVLFYEITSTGVLSNCSLDYKWNYDTTIGREGGFMTNAGSKYIFGLVSAWNDGTVENVTVNNYGYTKLFAREYGTRGDAEIYAGGFFGCAKGASKTINVSFNSYSDKEVFSLGARDWTHAGFITGETLNGTTIDGVIIDLNGFADNYKNAVTYHSNIPGEQHVGLVDGRTSSGNANVSNVYSPYKFTGDVWLNDGNHGRAVTYSYIDVNSIGTDNYTLSFDKSNGNLVLTKSASYEKDRVLYDISFNDKVVPVYELNSKTSVSLPKYNANVSNTKGLPIKVSFVEIGTINSNPTIDSPIYYGDGKTNNGDKLFVLPGGKAYNRDYLVGGDINSISKDQEVGNVQIKFAFSKDTKVLYHDPVNKIVVYNDGREEIVLENVTIQKRDIHVSCDVTELDLGGAPIDFTIDNLAKGNVVFSLGAGNEGLSYADGKLSATKSGSYILDLVIKNGDTDVTKNYNISYDSTNLTVNPIVFSYDENITITNEKEILAKNGGAVTYNAGNSITITELNTEVKVTLTTPVTGAVPNGLQSKLGDANVENEVVMNKDNENSVDYTMTVNKNMNKLAGQFKDKEYDITAGVYEGHPAYIGTGSVKIVGVDGFATKATYGETVSFEATAAENNYFIAWVYVYDNGDYKVASFEPTFSTMVRDDANVKALFDVEKRDEILVSFLYGSGDVWSEMLLEKTSFTSVEQVTEYVNSAENKVVYGNYELYQKFVGWEVYTDTFDSDVPTIIYKPIFETTKKVTLTINNEAKEYNFNEEVTLTKSEGDCQGWAVSTPKKDGGWSTPVVVSTDDTYTISAIGDYKIDEIKTEEEFNSLKNNPAILEYVYEDGKHFFVGAYSYEHKSAEIIVVSKMVGSDIMYSTPLLLKNVNHQFILQAKYTEVVKGDMKAKVIIIRNGGIITQSTWIDFNIA